MYKVYDFHCECGRIFERFVTSGTITSRCGCGNKATKMLSAPAFILDGSSGDFPGRHMRWIKEHEQAGSKSQSPQ